MANDLEKIIGEIGKMVLKLVNKKIVRKKSLKKVSKKTVKQPVKVKALPIHPWRLCPVGEHWVKAHQLKVPVSKKNSNGVTIRQSHCAKNPTGKDQLYPDEIKEVAERNFKNVTERPCFIDLGFNKDGQHGSAYDELISGWTKYWNNIFSPKVSLSPNTVKALIASESMFDPKILANKKKPASARGLMQITDETRKILADEKGELKNHYLTLTREDLNDPSNNICAGIRWLFRKQAIASSLRGKNATWDEAIFEFKSLRTAEKERAEELMKRFNRYLDRLSECKQ